ncbi:MAG: ABC transporter ATP-binding protein, partial [Chloroflexi bacterium]|nr:ABC transporter ATP-binding protein [Chloroflexota bacterium]
MTETPVVQIEGVARSFGRVLALAELSMTVPRGSVAVLVGPNGAGKTTAVRLMTGALRPQTGTIRVFGEDPQQAGESVRRRCGVVAAKPALYDRLTGRDNLTFAAELYEVPSAQERVAEAAERFGISNALANRVGGYSTGMKSRLALARAVLHDPELLLLDEPTAGLDPEAARAVLAHIDWLAETGKTVIMCTHLLLEAEGIADQVVIMDRGRGVVAGSPADLAERYWPPTVVLDAEDREQLFTKLERMEGIVAMQRNGHALVELDHLKRVPDLVAALTKARIRLTRVEPVTP